MNIWWNLYHPKVIDPNGYLINFILQVIYDIACIYITTFKGEGDTFLKVWVYAQMFLAIMMYKKKKQENLIKKLMWGSPREATGLIRNGLPQLNYYNKIFTEGWGFQEKGRVSLGHLHWNIATKRVYYHNRFVVESNWYPFFLTAQFKCNGWSIGSIWHEVITITCSRWTRFWFKEVTFCFATFLCRELSTDGKC